MSYLNSFTYQSAAPRFICDEGIHDLCIKGVKEEYSKNGAAMLCISCNVRSAEGKVFPGQYRIYLVEGPYFDNAYSRFLDCFGISWTNARPENFVNSIGKAKFDYFKYNSETKKSEKTGESQCHLLPKEGFVQPACEIASSAHDAPFTEKVPF